MSLSTLVELVISSGYTGYMTTLAPTLGFKLDDSTWVGDGLVWQISRERYHELIDAGAFAGDRVELIHGYLIRKMAVKPPHILVLQLLLRYLTRLVEDNGNWHLSSQNPIATDDSEPEPDIAVIRGGILDYGERLPEGNDLGLVVEISATTLAYDQKVKTALYASVGIPQYWIVDVEGRQIELHTSPLALEERAQYLNKTIYVETDNIPVQIEDELFGEIPVTSILPPA